jgi:hypothetical protein
MLLWVCLLKLVRKFVTDVTQRKSPPTPVLELSIISAETPIF